MKLILFLVAALCSASRPASAQAVADTNSYNWLINAAHEAIDRAEFHPSEDERTALYRKAELYARRAVAANPADVDGHFQLARALGRRALSVGPRERVKFATEVRSETLEALKISPRHAGALHILGRWNAEVMRVNGIVRLIARKLLGGAVFGEASWDNAQRNLEEAVALEPNRITHRLDLAEVYADRGQTGKAREQYEWIARAPVTDYNDRNYKEEASRRLKALR